MNNKKTLFKEKIILILVTALLSVSITLLVWGLNGTLPWGSQNFLSGDDLAQYASISKMFIRHLINGESLSYSFEFGLGMPTTALYAYYSLNPFNLLYLFFQDVDLALFFIVLSKLILISTIMALFIYTEIKCSYLPSVFFSLAYTFCGFLVNFHMLNNFIDMLYLFPLIVWGISICVRNGNWHPLCIIYAISFIMQFYCGYMMGVFSFIIFICYCIYICSNDIKKWLVAIKHYSIAVLIAVLLSAPITISAGLELLSNRTADVNSEWNLRLTVLDFIKGLLPGQSQGIYNTLPMMYCGIVSLLLFVLFFFNKGFASKIRIIALIPLAFLLLCSFWKPAYMIIHAFDAPDGYAFRFSWMFSFVICCYASKEADSLYTKTKSLKYITYTLCCVLLLEVIISSFTILNNVKLNIYKNRSYYHLWREQANISLNMISDYESDDPDVFYRLRYLNSPTDNISMLYGYNGCGYFSSIENGALRKMLMHCGYATAPKVIHDYGSTSAMQIILGQKYNIECGFIYGNNPASLTVTKNEYYLPLGCMTNDNICTISLDKPTPFDNINSLINTISGYNNDIFTISDSGYNLIPDNTEVIKMEEGIRLQRSSDTADSLVTIHFATDDTNPIYAYMSRWDISNDETGAPYIYSSIDNGCMTSASTILMPHIIKLQPNSDKIVELTILMNSQTSDRFDYERLSFATENTKALNEQIKILNANDLNIITFKDDLIEADIDVTEEKNILFTTIPWDKGWHLYVDGTESETFPLIDNALLGAKLPCGHHTIKMIYKNKWQLYSNIIGIVGLFLFFMTHYQKRKRINSEK